LKCPSVRVNVISPPNVELKPNGQAARGQLA
jgi:hypothetical protein